MATHHPTWDDAHYIYTSSSLSFARRPRQAKPLQILKKEELRDRRRWRQRHQLAVRSQPLLLLKALLTLDLPVMLLLKTTLHLALPVVLLLKANPQPKMVALPVEAVSSSVLVLSSSIFQ